ncbi:glycosyltransferase family 2 protein [Frateuria sp. GZRe12]|uniref:glycosyltransferase family 2 protein n=1 Tax=Frateuria sp. GZRe12 TaxID=3351533 RepID=UPI003EDC2547
MDTQTPELSVVIPCYRTEQALPQLLARLQQSLDAFGRPYEIILVDDCSPDGTAVAAAREVARHPNVRYIELMFNVGQFRALMCGFAHARGRYVVTMDDDLQHPPEEIGKLYQHLVAHPELDAVFGAYVTKQHSSGRNLGSLLVRTVNTYIFGKPPGLVMSSFRCLRRELVDTLLAHRTRYPVIGPLILSSTRRIANVPVQHDARQHGVSNYRLGRLIRTTLDNVLNFSALPLQLISMVGVVVAGISFIMGAVFLAIRLLRGTGATGWTSLFLAVNFYGGLSLLAVGIIGEYLIRILGESKGQPLYIVRRQLGEGATPAPQRIGEGTTASKTS